MQNKNRLLAYFGHHKCATAWINSIIRMVCHDLGLKFANVNNSKMFGKKLDLYIKENHIDFLAYTNAEIQYIKDIDDYLGFHVIRDPRDIVVSAYFSHLYSHSSKNWPGLVEHRSRLQQASLEEGLFIEMEFREKEFEALYNWNYSQENVLELKMEDIIISPYESMVDALSFLQLVEQSPSAKQRLVYTLISIVNRIYANSKGLIPFRFAKKRVPIDRVLAYIYENRFSKLSKGREKGEENLKSHYRKGVAGDWVNYFNDEHRRVFRRKYNDLLLKLGYETSPEW